MQSITGKGDSKEISKNDAIGAKFDDGAFLLGL